MNSSRHDTIVLQLLLTCLGRSLLVGLSDPTLGGAVQLVPAALGLIGYLRLTEPDPGKLETAGGPEARQVTRGAIVTAFALSVTSVCAGENMTGVIPIALVVANAGAQLVALFATFVYARQLAVRIPDTRLADYTRWVMWGWAACYSMVGVLLGLAAINVGSQVLWSFPSAALPVGLCVGVATLVLAILSLLLVIRYLIAFSKAARQARATWAADSSLTRRFD